MGKVAVIVDGGFLRAVLFKRKKTHPDSNEIYQTIFNIVRDKLFFENDELLRVFYYDCIPDMNNKNTYKNPVDKSPVSMLVNIDVAGQNKIFEELKNKDYLAE